MERPFVNNVEEYVNDFVRNVGGSLVLDILQSTPDFENADYYFQKENVLIELKCLEKDPFREEDDLERLMNLLNKWVQNGLLEQADVFPFIFGQRRLPNECAEELVSLCRKAMQRIVEKANKQLTQTRDKVGDKQTQRILMVCNDGNYFLKHQDILGLLCSLLGTRKEIEIDALIYTTVNQAVVIPNSDLDWSLWIPAYGDAVGENLQEFINDLGRKFHQYYCKKFNIPSSDNREYPDMPAGIEIIKGTKYIPKGVIYKEKRKFPKREKGK